MRDLIDAYDLAVRAGVRATGTVDSVKYQGYVREGVFYYIKNGIICHVRVCDTLEVSPFNRLGVII